MAWGASGFFICFLAERDFIQKDYCEGGKGAVVLERTP